MPRNFSGGHCHGNAPADASMRPRQMPRNFYGDAAAKARHGSSFNEAAADAAEFSDQFYFLRVEQIRFNEAAADAAEFCKHYSLSMASVPASMRPRQMPRNFGSLEQGMVGREFASMRPRQMPRNFRVGHGNPVLPCLASMRPRQMPRNFADSGLVTVRGHAASMRPRQMPRNFCAVFCTRCRGPELQ